MTQNIPKVIVDSCAKAYDAKHQTGVGSIEDLVKSDKVVKYKYEDHTQIDAGNFLGSTRNQKGELICYKSKEYYHSLTVASTGLGKTQTYILPSLMNLSGKESAIVVGPKGEEVRYTYNYLTKLYGKENVEILNFTQPNHTSVYYNPLCVYAERYVKSFSFGPTKRKTEQEAIFVDLQKLIDATFPIPNANDVSWHLGARSLIEGIIIGCICDCSDEYLRTSPIIKTRGLRKKLAPQDVNFKTVWDIFLRLQWITEGVSWGDSGFFTERKDELAKSKAQSVLGTTANGTRSSFLSVVNTLLVEYLSPKTKEISKYNTLDISSYQERPKVLYVMYDMSDGVVKSWVNDLVKNLITILNDMANSSETGKLKIKTLFYLDEFPALASGEDIYPKILSVGRGAGIFLNLCIQSYSQLKTAYEKSFDTIIENCNVKYFMGSNHASCVKTFMEELGTVEKPSKDDMYKGLITNKTEPRIKFEKLMFEMSPGDCYIKTVFNAPTYIKMAFFYNTPEYNKYPTFNVFKLKSPKVFAKQQEQSNALMTEETKKKSSEDEEEQRMREELKRIELELRRREILKRMRANIEEIAEEEEEE